MRRMSRIVGCGVIMSVSMPVLADLPAVLDRVPANAGLVAAVTNLADFHTRVSGLVTLLGMEEAEFGQGVKMAGMFLDTPGLNRTGSVAVAIMPGADGTLDFDGEQPPMAIFVPLSDFGKFAEAFDGVIEQSVATLDMMGETMYLRDVGGGYGVLGQDLELVKGFKTDAGQTAGHELRLGATGQRVASTSEFFIAVDIQSIAPMLREAADGMKENFEMASMMMGEQAAGMESMAALLQQSVDDIIRDGQVGLLGLDLSDVGVSLDLGAHFKDGSETAAFMQATGNATSLLGRVPNMPFIFAMSLDMSSPGVKRLFTQMADFSAKMSPEQADMMAFMNIGKLLEDQGGMSMVMGNPPSLMMGGLFSQTVQYTQCGNPGETMAEMRKAMEAMDGKSSGPMTMKTTYKPNAAQVDGTSVDSWGLQMKVDPADPAGNQMGMGLMMIFGASGGPSGYYGKVRDGVVTTFAQNSGLMSQALKAAAGGAGMNDNEAIRIASEQLPAGTVAQFYLGLDAIAQQASGLMAMAGQGLDVEIPENLGALAIGATMSDGGVQGRLFVPSALVKFVSQVVESQRAQAAEADAPAPQGGGNRPRF